MSKHSEWGFAATALYTLDTPKEAIERLTPEDDGEITSPFVLGLWNGNGDGLALQGTRREILDYLKLATEYVARETDPRLPLDQALNRLAAHREEIAAAAEHGNYSTCARRIARLEEQEVDLLNEVAELAEAVNENLFPY